MKSLLDIDRRRRELIKGLAALGALPPLAACGGGATTESPTGAGIGPVAAPAPNPLPSPAPIPISIPAMVTGAYRSGQTYLFQGIGRVTRPSTLGGGGFNANSWAPMYWYVDAHTGWKWANPGGDWLDATLTPQGASPWHSFLADSANGSTAVFSYTGISITKLVQHCQASDRPCAFMLRVSGGPRQLASLYSTLGPVPVINVSYTDGSTAVLACRVLATSTKSSALPENTGDRIGFPAFVEFDRPTKPVQSATTNLTITAHWSGSATVQYFLINPPVNTEAVTGTTGLAASSDVLDAGIHAVPGVIGAQRYVDGSALTDFCVPGAANFGAESNYDPVLWGGKQDLSKWPHTVLGKWINTNDPNAAIPPELVSSAYSGEGFKPLAPGLGAIKVSMPDSGVATGEEGNYFGTVASNMKLFMPEPQMGRLGRIFVRYYIRLGAPQNLTPASRREMRQGGRPKWADMGGKFGIGPAHPYMYGGSSINSGGSGGWGGWQLRHSWSECDEGVGGPSEGGLIPGWHLYDFGNNPSGYNYIGEGYTNQQWGQMGGLGGVLYAGRWYLVETEIKLNSVDTENPSDPGKYYTPNGELRTWIDGRLAYERTGLVMRSLPRYSPPYDGTQLRPHRELGISELWWNWFHGGTTQSTVARTQFITGLAYGTSRIGPMKLPGGAA